MAVSKRVQAARAQKFNKNIHKRGNVPVGEKKKEAGSPVGPILLGFFLFVVVGSALLQILRTATSGSPF